MTEKLRLSQLVERKEMSVYLLSIHPPIASNIRALHLINTTYHIFSWRRLLHAAWCKHRCLQILLNNCLIIELHSLPEPKLHMKHSLLPFPSIPVKNFAPWDTRARAVTDPYINVNYLKTCTHVHAKSYKLFQCWRQINFWPHNGNWCRGGNEIKVKWSSSHNSLKIALHMGFCIYS